MAGAPDLAPPEGCVYELERLVDAVEVTNRAHASLGTKLLGLQPDGATIGVEWRAELSDERGALAPGVVSLLLDHVCSFTAFLSLNGEHGFGATTGLRVERYRPIRPGRAVHARAVCHTRTSGAMFLRGGGFHPDSPEEPIAGATCTVTIVPAAR